jgi:HD-GYP domain-containing protein (c-di-GMP phosphodiesterase class II)
MPFRQHTKITIAYLAAGALWILSSDAAAHAVFGDLSRLTWAQSAKGIVFVLVTGVLLHALSARSFRRLEHAHAALLESYDQTIRGWVRALDLRHRETKDHSIRVTRMTVAMARLLGIRGDALVQVERGALLHDIGKLGIPDAILVKQGPLDDEERRCVERHPSIAHAFLADIEFLRPCLDIPFCHHERWDGGGYPRGLRGEAIPLAARIFAVVDVWDALSFDRVYRGAWTQDEVVAHLEREAGRHFDPRLVRVFLAHRPALVAIGTSDGPTPELGRASLVHAEATAVLSDRAASTPAPAPDPSARTRSTPAAP